MKHVETMKAIVIGGANIDIKSHIEVAVTLGTSNPGQVRLSVGGVGRNIAHNLALLGCETHLITALSPDAHGDMLRLACEAVGIQLHTVQSAQPTGTYTAILDSLGDLVIGVAAMQSIDALTPETVAGFEADVVGTDILIADANLSGATLAYLAALAQALCLDFACEPVSVVKAVRIKPLLGRLPLFLLSPNRAQLAVLTGHDVSRPADLAPACTRLHEDGVRHVIVGLGPEGAFWSDGQRCGHVPALARTIVDATGGGDAALAAAVWGMKQGLTLEQAAHIGQRAAALTVTCAETVNPQLSPEHVYAEVP